jgi:hypothetical protein
MSRRAPARLVCLWIAGIVLASGSPVSADLDADAAEALARARWMEGIPEESLEPLTAAAQTRLAQLLADPAEAPHHAAALEIMGRAGGEGAYDAIAAYAGAQPAGVADAGLHRAQLTVPLALGHLADVDDRALEHLIALAESAPAPASWRHAHLSATRVDRLRRELAVTGLALSGRARAGAVLRRLAGRGGGPQSDLQAHAERALRVHAERVAR